MSETERGLSKSTIEGEKCYYEDVGYTIFDFTAEMSPKPLMQFRRNPGDPCVFWSEDHDHTHSSSSSIQLLSIEYERITKNWVRNKITSALCSVNNSTYKCLVQFWAPTMIGGQCRLTTSNLPFGLTQIDRGLCEYRKQCVNYEIIVEGDSKDVVGRVFQYKCPYLNLCVEIYSDNPLGNIAVKCGVQRPLALPLFEPSGQWCLGVLELVDTGRESSTIDLPPLLLHMFQDIEMETCYMCDCQQRQVEEDIQHMDEIYKVLKVVCTTHQLPLAQTWIPCRHSCNSFDLTCTQTYAIDELIYLPRIGRFHEACLYHKLRKGQGIVGKALLSRKPCFSPDISQFPITEYPLADYARRYGLNRCFAICLRSICTKYLDYVLEFFLPSNVDLAIMYSLLATMKKHFQNFEIASGEVGFFVSDEADSFKICQTSSPPPTPEPLQNEREEGPLNASLDLQLTVETVIEDGLNVSGAENDVVVLCENAREDLSIEEVKIARNDDICQTTRHPPMPEALQNEREEVQLNISYQQLTVKSVTQKRPNVYGAGQNDVVVTCLEKKSRVETLEGEHRTTNISFAELKQHFGMKLEDAADGLGVSRSTLKRMCRKHGIEKWPFPKKKKVNSSPSNLKHVSESVRGGNEEIPESTRSDPSCSDAPPKRATAFAAAQTTPDITPFQDAVTIKAEYRELFIKFKLSFSSGMTELVENITERLQLQHGTFTIKYKDDDGDQVLIACDKDVWYHMDSWRSLPKNATIRLLVDDPIASHAP